MRPTAKCLTGFFTASDKENLGAQSAIFCASFQTSSCASFESSRSDFPSASTIVFFTTSISDFPNTSAANSRCASVTVPPLCDKKSTCTLNILKMQVLNLLIYKALYNLVELSFEEVAHAVLGEGGGELGAKVAFAVDVEQGADVWYFIG